MEHERTSVVKMLGEDSEFFSVGGYGVVWDGADMVGETFTKDGTDFWFDRLTETPMVLYGHGLDKKMTQTVIGKVTTKAPDDFGLWIEAQIRANETWSGAVRDLLGQNVLGWSSGAVAHLVDKKRSGKKMLITSWPIAEWSLVPNPCEPRALGVQELRSLAEADPSIKSVLTDDDLAALKAPQSTDTRNALSDSQFAYVDAEGGRHLPINDEARARNAMARFGQTQFESPAKKKAAARKIMAAARKFGIDMAMDSEVAMASKSWSVKDMAKARTAIEGAIEIHKGHMASDAPPSEESEAREMDLLQTALAELEMPQGDAASMGKSWQPSLKDMSFEERKCQIEMMLNPRMPFPMDGPQPYICVMETYEDHVIACRMDGMGEQTYWSIDYSVDPDTEMITLSAPVEVEQTYVPVAIRSISARPLEASVIEATNLYHAVTAEAKALGERRIKEGRVLSTVNRSRLEGLLKAIDGATSDIRDLLAATAPADMAKALDVDTLRRREFLANTTRLRTLQAALATGD